MISSRALSENQARVELSDTKSVYSTVRYPNEYFAFPETSQWQSSDMNCQSSDLYLCPLRALTHPSSTSMPDNLPPHFNGATSRLSGLY